MIKYVSKKIGLDLYFQLYFNFLTRIDVQMIWITYSRVNEDFSIQKHPLCEFFSFKLSNILIIGSKLIWQNFLRKLVFLNFIFFYVFAPNFAFRQNIWGTCINSNLSYALFCFRFLVMFFWNKSVIPVFEVIHFWDKFLTCYPLLRGKPLGGSKAVECTFSEHVSLSVF